MLSLYRVIDLTDERGQLAGQILAMMGAEVILVEPPGGSASRRVGPFAGDIDDIGRSLAHWAHNRGKRSVVIDHTTAEGRAALRRLLEGADVVFDHGEHPDDLFEGIDTLVRITITAFGVDGPKADWASTDLTLLAAGGQLLQSGDSDRPPVRVSVPQAWYHAAGDAASGALLALYERSRSGLGQRGVVAAARSVLQATQSMVLAHLMEASPAMRAAGGVRLGPLHVQLAWPCRDGHVSITFLFGQAIGPFSQRLMDWMCEEGFCDEATRDKSWIDYVTLLLSGQEPFEEYERVKELIGAFAATKTKAELLAAALERRLLIAPVTTIDDILGLDQLHERDVWERVDDPELGGTAVAPSCFAKFSATPCARLGRAARLGEHTAAVLAEPARRPADLPTHPVPGHNRPLEGVHVLDLMWVMAGPTTTRALADFGATVVHVESVHHVDTARTIQPFWKNATGFEYSGLFANMNTNKLGVALDLGNPVAHEVLHDLLRWADVVTESFSPRAMKAWGLDYQSVAAINPSIIMLSSCLFGQTGPLSGYAGYGTLGSSFGGFFNLAGWPDRAPAGPFGAYTDYISPRLSTAAVLAAIDHRRRTGEGQYIDFSQIEGSLLYLGPAILERALNGRDWGRWGNDDRVMAPHGVYPVMGDDRWVAVACQDTAAWRATADALGLDADLDPRAVDRRTLDELLAARTAGWEADALVEVLQARGVAAHLVQTSEDCTTRDPQLAHLGHFVGLDHPEVGTSWVEGPRVDLSRTPGRVERAAPTLGQDTYDVLTGILGYDDERIGDLFASEALE